MTCSTIRLTVAQAVVTYLSRQYSVADGGRRRLIPATLGIFGHGNVAGLGQALDQLAEIMPFIQGRNEQALVHAAVGFAKHSRRHATLAVTASIGPGAMNLVTGAALATVNRLPGAAAARRHLRHPASGPGAAAAAAPGRRRPDRERRVPPDLAGSSTGSPAPSSCSPPCRPRCGPWSTRSTTGAVVLSLPQDVQSHAYDFPAEFFARARLDDPPPRARPGTRSHAVAELLAAAKKPLIIAGGGVDLLRRHRRAGAPRRRRRRPGGGDVRRQGRRADQAAWWQVGGIGLEGTPATNTLAREADLVLTVGSRLTDFATGSHSIFANPDVRFASINVNVRDADRLGATGVIGDAKRALAALADAVAERPHTSRAWRARVEELTDGVEHRAGGTHWTPTQLFDKSAVPADSDVVTTTDAVLTQGQIIGVLQEHARSGDVIVAAAGGPPGDLQKVWDATDGRTCHLEFGFSCMGYEIPAAMGVRMAHPDPDARITAFLGDGTFLMAPTELVTAAQEGLPITLVVPENHGYQVIHRLQMFRNGREFGNEFRYRTQPSGAGRRRRGGQGGPPGRRLPAGRPGADRRRPGREGGARRNRPPSCAPPWTRPAATRAPSSSWSPAIPHADLPPAGVWWDVAPAEVSEIDTVPPLRAEYEQDRTTQRWFG